MPVGFRSSSIRGVDDQQTTSCAIPVPPGAATGDIVVCSVGRWTPVGGITIPAEFTPIATGVRFGPSSVNAFWKRLTAADTGDYTFSWGTSQWNNGNAICITGALTSGDPIEDVDTGGVNGSTYPSLTVTTLTEPFLAWGTYNDALESGTPAPTGYTAIDAQNDGASAWRIPATTGDHTASGATASAVMNLVAILAAIKPAGSPARESTDLTFLGSTTWVAGSTSVAPTYLSGLAEGDVVYAVVHNRPDTVVPSTPASWRLVGTALGGGGTQGAGTGLTRVTVFKRLVPAGGLSGSQSITITSGNSAQAHMRAYRASGTNLQYRETFSFYSRATASTTIDGTAEASLVLDTKDIVVMVMGSPDDTTTTLTVSGISATGATFGSLTRSPDVTAAVTTTGNDLAANAYEATVTAGSSNAAPAITGTANASETGIGALFRVRATVDTPLLAIAPPRRLSPNFRR